MISHVAIKFQDRVFSLPRPNRHHNVIDLIVKETGVPFVRREIQGFLDADGNFMDRKEAAVYAKKVGQIPNLKWPPNLYSEDLW